MSEPTGYLVTLATQATPHRQPASQLSQPTRQAGLPPTSQPTNYAASDPAQPPSHPASLPREPDYIVSLGPDSGCLNPASMVFWLLTYILTYLLTILTILTYHTYLPYLHTYGNYPLDSWWTRHSRFPRLRGQLCFWRVDPTLWSCGLMIL